MEFVTVDNIINFLAALACRFINHGDTYRRFNIVPTAVTTPAEHVDNSPPLFSALHLQFFVSL